MSKKNLEKTLIILTKVFFIGLLLQFFLQTFVHFGLGRWHPIWSGIWMWKEIIILILFVLICYWIRTHKIWKKLLKSLDLKKFLILLWVFVILWILNWLLISKVWLSATIISLRYSISGFVIFAIFATISRMFIDKKNKIEWWRSKVLKIVLWWALFWRGIIYLVPRLLEFGWYNQYNYEWSVGIAPPAVYYSQYNQWYVRNQFLFERPISFGFFLIAFWPLFFTVAIKRKWWGVFFVEAGFYWLIVLSTFSRAARIAWIIQTAILLFIEHRKNIKKALIYWGIPILLIFGWVAYIGRHQIIHREFSNTGHIVNLQIAFEKIKNKPFFGEWPGSAGPASHQIEWQERYNPENQFLQIWIEYWVVGFLIWMFLYIRFIRIGTLALYQSSKNKKNKEARYQWYLLFALSLGIFGLGICGLVLHSFVDRMIVYPFMAMFGITYWKYIKIRDKDEKRKKKALRF